MSTFPLDEPHIAALRWAATALRDEPAKAARLLEAIHGFKGLVTKLIPENEAMLALSSPSSAAQLVRDLLGACGLFLLPVDEGVAIQYPAVRVDVDADSFDYIAWTAPKTPWHIQRMLPHEAIPALILALLDALALPEGRKEAALKALREADAGAAATTVETGPFCEWPMCRAPISSPPFEGCGSPYLHADGLWIGPGVKR